MGVLKEKQLKNEITLRKKKDLKIFGDAFDKDNSVKLGGQRASFMKSNEG